MEEEKQDKATQLALHSVKNLLGNQQQIDLFSEHHIEFCEEYDVKLEGTIDRFGIDLTEIQSRVMEGILYGFSKTAYKGNIEPTSKESLVDERFSGKVPSSYKYIQEIPKLRVTQSELLEWSGINKQSIASWSRAVEAIQELGRKQYCFYYDRLALDAEGTPLKEKNNKWKKEEVFSVDTLFSIKEIRDKSSGSLKYYEIMPSSVFLDQRESYFMFIPLNWREEVKKLVGNKKASSYTFRFLLFLRYQYELKRRSKSLKPPYRIRWSPAEIAMAIKMPPSIYKRKKKRVNQILDDAYAVAKRLGYLIDYQRTGHLDILTLNEKKYFNNRSLSYNLADVLDEKADKNLSAAKSLYELFHSQKRKIDPYYHDPEENKKEKQYYTFQKLLSARPFEVIERLICWSTTKKYWCSRLSTPVKLSSNFSEAWSEMVLGSEFGADQSRIRNKELAEDLLKKVAKGSQGVESHKIKTQEGTKVCGIRTQEGIKVEILNESIEFIHGGVSSSTCIQYDDDNFEALLRKSLKKYGLSVH